MRSLAQNDYPQNPETPPQTIRPVFEDETSLLFSPTVKKEVAEVVDEILENHSTWDTVKDRTKEECSALCHGVFEIMCIPKRWEEALFEGQTPEDRVDFQRAIHGLSEDWNGVEVADGHRKIDEWFGTDLAGNYPHVMEVDENGVPTEAEAERIGDAATEMMIAGGLFKSKIFTQASASEFGLGKIGAVEELGVNGGNVGRGKSLRCCC